MLVSVIGFSQQRPETNFQFNNYFLNPHAINPALSGIEKSWMLRLGGRYVRDEEFGQVQSTLSFNGSFYQPDIRQNSIRISEPEAYTEQETEEAYRKRMQRHGLGAYLATDDDGDFINYTGKASYAYHIPVSRKLTLSTGIGLGYQSFRIGGRDYHDRDWEKVDPVRDALEAGGIAKNQLDANVGLTLYSEQYYLGFAASQLILANFNSDDVLADKTVYKNYSGQLGYNFSLSPDVQLRPGLVANYNNLNSAEFFGNVKVVYDNSYWIGGSYKNKQAYAVLLGAEISNRFSVAYAFEHNISDMQNQFGSGHEVVLGFRFRNRENHRPYFW